MEEKLEEKEELVMEPNKKRLELDEVLHLLGGIGRFQVIMVVLTGLILFPTTMAILIPYFTQDTPAWTCVSNSTICNLNGTHPMDSKTYKARCDMPRTEWKFTQPKDFSIVTQFDLYCETEAYNYLAISMVFVSWGIGAPLLGWMADRFGRRRIALPSIIAVCLFGFIGAFSPSFTFYIISRFLVGFFIPGSAVQIFVIFQEVVAPKHRPFAAALINVGWALATIVLGVLAIFVRSWKTLTMVVFGPFALCIASYLFVMESIRWLHLNGKTDDVMKLLDRVAKQNNKKLPEIELVPLKHDSSNGLRHFLNIFRPTKVAVRSLIQGYTWIVFGLVYYGVAFAAGDLGGSKYRDFLLSVSCSLPAAFIAVYLPNKFGRKKSVIIPAMIAGVACIIVALIPARSGLDNRRSNLTTIRVIIGLIGKLGITIAFDIIYLWSSEIYPTVTRSAGLGYLQVTARIGSALAPWVAKWLQIFHVAIPFSLMGGLAFIAGILLLLLPETKNCKTADTLDDQYEQSQANMDALIGDTEKNTAI